jgi:hypothetical protein
MIVRTAIAGVLFQCLLYIVMNISKVYTDSAKRLPYLWSMVSAFIYIFFYFTTQVEFYDPAAEQALPKSDITEPLFSEVNPSINDGRDTEVQLR